MEITYKLNGKSSSKEDIENIPEAKFIKVVKTHVEEYETELYTQKAKENSRKFFERLEDNRDELDTRHG